MDTKRYNENYCEKCKDITSKEDCIYRKHERKCVVCGECRDCLEYKKAAIAWEDMVNDPEYFFEPWDEFDYPERGKPQPPQKRFTAFPSGGIEVKEIGGMKVEKKDRIIALILPIQIYHKTESQLAGTSAVLSGYSTKEIQFFFCSLDGGPFVRHFDESIWKDIKKHFTKDAMESYEQYLLSEALTRYEKGLFDVLEED